MYRILQIVYDLSTQVSPAELPALRAQILTLLKQFASGPKPIRVQLCVCLANLAIQMKDWKDVLPVVVNSLGNEVESHACILDFLRILPEEVTEGRKITLTVRRKRNDGTNTTSGCSSASARTTTADPQSNIMCQLGRRA